jgi:hypothetical protein
MPIPRRNQRPAARGVLAVLLLTALLFGIAAGSAAAYENKYEIYVYPKNNNGNIYPDPCYTSFSWEIWMECPSHDAAVQFHNWKEENVTNTGNRSGYIEAWGATNSEAVEEFVWAYGNKGTYAYSKGLPGYLGWPLAGATGWVSGSSEAGDWEQTRGKLD